MNVGTLEIDEIDEPGELVRGGPRTSGGGGGNGGDGGDGNEGRGGSGPFDPRNDEDLVTDGGNAKYRILTFFLLVVVLMTFGGLMAAYVVIHANNVQEWQPFALPFQVWISTALIAAGSILYYLFERNASAGRLIEARKWLMASMAVSALFVASQLAVWAVLMQAGFYVRGNPYAGFFYILTAVHAVHVIAGIIALWSVFVRFRRLVVEDVFNEQRLAIAKTVGWYMHFLAILWFVLVFFLGFWK
ncbi:MAG: cytochrome c oxidase subunit 3 [Blastocatellia bacterium]|nr:cytochrome c oxidase subunit 3 [Blastocatellia bacterium]